MDIFEHCAVINDYFKIGDAVNGRDELIKLLHRCDVEKLKYNDLINNLIRQSGLYPYIDTETAGWRERFIHEAFKVNVGGKQEVTLHKEQSNLLKSLLSGNSVAVSAPTSFGKSFIIDAYIAIRKPKNVVIIVPTIALTDETRRRIYKKFANNYKIITTSEATLGDKNILIFPQERAIHYANILQSIDMLIIDEFYKASIAHDKERAASLQNAIMKLGDISVQKYFLAPNITTIKDNPFTRDMLIIDKLSFSTVFLKVFTYYDKISTEDQKKQKLLELLEHDKSLIYAALFKEIDKVSEIILQNLPNHNDDDIKNFSIWLQRNYSADWTLPSLILKGVGVHNGRLHRSISQIQIRLFEEENKLMNIISTSSIIEGVNTSAKKVILWSNKSGAGNSNLKNFTYKNIKGRSGRMFKHFVGEIHELVKPPEDIPTQLDLGIPDSLLSNIDSPKYIQSLDDVQLTKIKNFEEEIGKIIDIKRFKILQREHMFQSSDSELILKIARDINNNRTKWNGLNYLNSDKIESWSWLIKSIIFLDPKSIRWDNSGLGNSQYDKFVIFIQILSKNWTVALPKLLKELADYEISIDDFFNLEKKVCYAFSSLLNDVNILQKEILKDKQFDISSFISKVSHAFLPPVVYQLEEYGLPRMISKKIHYCDVIDLTNKDLTIHETIDILKKVGKDNLIIYLKNYLIEFDYYILDFFYEGISVDGD